MLLTTLGLVLIAVGLSAWIQRFRSRHWIPVTGEILSSGTERDTAIQGRTVSRFSVSYRYSVSGAVHHAQRLAFGIPEFTGGEASVLNLPPNSLRRGQACTVFVDPKNSDSAVLQRRVTTTSSIVAVAGLSMLAVAAYFRLVE